MTTCLVTGGAGYIGSHTTLELLKSGFDVVVLDNLSNSSYTPLTRVAQLAGRSAKFVEADIRDTAMIVDLLVEHEINSVLHFAGLKAVGESVKGPIAYYDNNVCGTISLCKAMAMTGVFSMVFSSSATVYGDSNHMPLNEGMPTGKLTNPYGRTKVIVEEMLRDLVYADSRWCVGVLRYFNPVGAHPSGLMGEDPTGSPANLLPYVSQVALGKREKLHIFGNDYPTKDGTGVRDYIHVVDVARGHIKALEAINMRGGLNFWNLGTGRGYSVLDIVQVFEKISGRRVRYSIAPRRPGDVAECWADASRAWRDLGWRAEYKLEDMISDCWRWQLLNPNGYQS